MNINSRTKKIALCGILAALTLVMLYIGGMTVFDLCTIVVGALVTMIVAVETGAKFAWLYAAVTSIISLVILPSKLFAIEYIILGALYPIMKMYFEKCRALIAWPIKISFLDTALMFVLAIGKKIADGGADLPEFGYITMLIASVIFVIYDLALSFFISFYMVKLRNKFTSKKLF